MLHGLREVFLHPPETHVSSPDLAPSPEARGSPGQEEQHHVLATFNIQVMRPGVAPIWTLMKGKGYFDPRLTLISGQSSAKLKTERVRRGSKGSA